MPSELWSRSIQCEDPYGREKEADVLIGSDGCVAIKFPPGEGVTFRSVEDAHKMQVALREAIEEWHRRNEGSA